MTKEKIIETSLQVLIHLVIFASLSFSFLAIAKKYDFTDLMLFLGGILVSALAQSVSKRIKITVKK